MLGSIKMERWNGNCSPPSKIWTIFLFILESRFRSLASDTKLCKCWPIIMTDFPSCILNPLPLVITSLSEKHDRYSCSTSLYVSAVSCHLSVFLHIIYCMCNSLLSCRGGPRQFQHCRCVIWAGPVHCCSSETNLPQCWGEMLQQTLSN